MATNNLKLQATPEKGNTDHLSVKSSLRKTHNHNAAGKKVKKTQSPQVNGKQEEKSTKKDWKAVVLCCCFCCKMNASREKQMKHSVTSV